MLVDEKGCNLSARESYRWLVSTLTLNADLEKILKELPARCNELEQLLAEHKLDFSGERTGECQRLTLVELLRDPNIGAVRKQHLLKEFHFDLYAGRAIEVCYADAAKEIEDIIAKDGP